MQKYLTYNDLAFGKTSWISKLVGKATRPLSKSKQTQGVNVDFSNAINNIDHNVPINKLSYYDVNS